MNGLIVGDFVNVKKECDVLNIENVNEITNMLYETAVLKESKDIRTNIDFAYLGSQNWDTIQIQMEPLVLA